MSTPRTTGLAEWSPSAGGSQVKTGGLGKILERVIGDGSVDNKYSCIWAEVTSKEEIGLGFLDWMKHCEYESKEQVKYED